METITTTNTTKLVLPVFWRHSKLDEEADQLGPERWLQGERPSPPALRPPNHDCFMRFFSPWRGKWDVVSITGKNIQSPNG